MDLVMEGGIAAALGLLALFGGIALLAWVCNKGESEKRKLKHELDLQRGQLEHAERLKSLEAGLPLPDAELAQARVEKARTTAVALIGVIVPTVTAAAAVLGTTVVLREALPQHHLPVLCVIWGSSGLAILVTAVTSLGVVAKRRFSKKPPVAAARALAEHPPKLEQVGTSR